MKVKADNMAGLATVLVTVLFLDTKVLAAVEYQDLADVVAAVQANANASGGDAAALTLKNGSGLEIHTEGVTLPVTPIWSLTISKSGGNGSRKNILVTGTQHAREWVAYR